MTGEEIISLRGRLYEILRRLPTDDNTNNAEKMLSSFLDVFLVNQTVEEGHLKRKGAYRTLMLGTDNLDLVWCILGSHADILINKQARYIISIERKFSGNSLSFEFGQRKTINEEQERLLSRLFHTYGSGVDRNRHSDKIPGLILSGIDLTLITNPSDDIRLLLSSNLVEKLSIGIAVDSLSSVSSLITRLDIVPAHYTGPEGLTIGLLSSTLNLLTSYNFVIANSQDDYLLKVFFEIAQRYREQFGFDTDLSANLLKLVFLANGDYWSQTRLFGDNPGYKKILPLMELGSTLESRHLVPNVIGVLASTLNLMDAMNLTKKLDKAEDRQSLSELPDILNNFVSDIFKILNSYEQGIKQDSQKLLKATERLEQVGKELKASYDKKIEDREFYLKQVALYLSDLLDFVDCFSKHFRDDVIRTIQRFENDSPSYLDSEKKLFLFTKHRRSDTEFRSLLDSALGFGRDVLAKVTDDPEMFSFQLLGKDFAALLQRYEQKIETAQGLVDHDLWQICQFVLKISEVKNNIIYLVNEFEVNFNEQFKQLLPSSRHIKETSSEIIQMIQSNSDIDRAIVFSKIKDYSIEILNFANSYVPNVQGEVLEIQKSLTKNEIEMIEKGFKDKYIVKIDEFENYVLEHLDKLDELSSKLYDAIQIPSLNSLTTGVMTTLNNVKGSNSPLNIRQSIQKLNDSFIIPEIKHALANEIILLAGIQVEI